METLKKQYQIDQAVVVADSAMIDQSNQEFRAGLHIGDRIKNLPKKIIAELLDINWGRGELIICTYSQKRANKDSFEQRLKNGWTILHNTNRQKQKERQSKEIPSFFKKPHSF